MKVKELIEELKKYDGELDVSYYIDCRHKINKVEMKYVSKPTFPKNSGEHFVALVSDKNKSRKQYDLYEEDIMALRLAINNGIELNIKEHTLYNIKNTKKFPLRVYDKAYEQIKHLLPNKLKNDLWVDMVRKKIKNLMKQYNLKVSVISKKIDINPRTLTDIKNNNGDYTYDKLYFVYKKIRDYLNYEYKHQIADYDVEKDYYNFFRDEIIRMVRENGDNIINISLKLGYIRNYIYKLLDKNTYHRFDKMKNVYYEVKGYYESKQ